MKLLLSSDGKTAIENIHKLTDKPVNELKIAWILTATKTDENSNFINQDLHAFLENGVRPIIYDIKGKTLDDFNRELKELDIIFMEGGNTFYLLKAVRESGFDKFLNRWVKHKPYIGVSAGSYVACPSIVMATWKNPNRDKHGLEDLTGLGYVDFLLTVHYQDDYKDSIVQGMKNTDIELRILKDGQALLINDGQVILLGDQNIVDITF